jgi:hypothetical protein
LTVYNSDVEEAVLGKVGFVRIADEINGINEKRRGSSSESKKLRKMKSLE